MSRREFLSRSAVAGVATAVSGLTGGQLRAQLGPVMSIPRAKGTPACCGWLYLQQNQVRNVLDTSGLWQFQLDPKEEGEAQGWFKALPAPRPVAVPCSWNDLFDDARDYLGVAWYLNEFWIPSGWHGQRVFLRVGSANYAAKVWGQRRPHGRAFGRVSTVRCRHHQSVGVGSEKRHCDLGREQTIAGARPAGASARRRRIWGHWPRFRPTPFYLRWIAPSSSALLGPGCRARQRWHRHGQGDHCRRVRRQGKSPAE
jgi:hypothetical protein